jgi:hypothetical protein
LPAKAKYLFNERALAVVFRAKLLAALQAHGLVLPKAPLKWVAHCKRVGDGRKALVYLGRYLYRGVIQEHDILACDGVNVTYRWREGKTGEVKISTLAGAAFLWRILQHVLPRGFRRARNHGFLHPNSKRLVALLRLLVFRPPSAPVPATQRPVWACRCCGWPMLIVRRRMAPQADDPTGIATQATT